MYWGIAAIPVKSAIRRAPLASHVIYTLPTLIAVWLLFMRPPYEWLVTPVFPASAVVYAIGVALVAIGLAFTVWARICLGRNWSASVTVKHQHELIRHGAYAWVRHPIYTGILAAFLGTGVAVNQWRYLVAFVVILAALRFKWRLEEKCMQETFGDDYTSYRRKVPAIIPQPWRH